MPLTEVVSHPRYLAYNFGPEHPFTPLRLTMLHEVLEALQLEPITIRPRLAEHEEVLTVHSEAFVEQVTEASLGKPLPDAVEYGLDTPDVPVFRGMDEAARMIAGGTLQAAQLITAGQAERVLQLGGGLHHAMRARAAGFCVYNDLAIAIRHLRSHDLRVAYVDIDVHHGDGVQALFYDDPDVLTISIHESGRYLFPGTGSIDELGTGAGEGYSLNVPLEPYTSDEGYLAAFERVVPFALARFVPDVLVVPCGADAHFRDPLADLRLTSHAFERLFRRLLELSDEHTAGRILLTLGGGYDLDATVRLWAMLYHLVWGYPLPERLPPAWLRRWEQRLHTSLTKTLHDPAGDHGAYRRFAAEEQNKQTSRQVLERAATFWD